MRPTGRDEMPKGGVRRSFMEYVRVELENNKLTNAELTAHREIIDEYVGKGYKYVGYIPVSFGPSGKTLAIDLIFEKP